MQLNHSVYGYSAFLVSMAVFAGGAVLSLIAIVVLVIVGKRCSTHRSMVIPRSIVAAFVILFCFVVVTLACVSGFGYMHPAISIALCCVSWVVMVSCSMYFYYAPWRYSAVEVHRTVAEQQRPLLSPLAVSLHIILRRPKLFHSVCLLGYLASFAVAFGLYGICFCSNPIQFTSWSSRRSQAHYCVDEQFCHQYVMLGRNSSRVRLVGHVVTRFGAPTATWARLCYWNSVARAANCSVLNRTVPGALWAHVDNDDEDPRYLSHILLRDLHADTAYAADVFITLGDRATTIRKSIAFRTVTNSTASEFRFISGGDMFSGPEGMQMWYTAFSVSPSPSFVLLGGDLAYTNNLRTCFLRLDYFCSHISALRSQDGLSVPILIVPGNHESGGYRPETDWNRYFFFLPYFPQYDDDVPASPYVTHHSHDIGLLTVLGLDSGLYEAPLSQVGYATGVLASSLSRRQTVVAAYHNGMYPSIRDPSNANAEAMRAAFLGVLVSYNVTLALEFHDHAYKRTYFAQSDGPREAYTSGIVFVGDGGIGASLDASVSGSHPYVRVFTPQFNIQVIDVHVNGSLTVRSYGSTTQQLLDQVTLTSRSR